MNKLLQVERNTSRTRKEMCSAIIIENLLLGNSMVAVATIRSR